VRVEGSGTGVYVTVRVTLVKGGWGEPLTANGSTIDLVK
jgi:hypothetical protein